MGKEGLPIFGGGEFFFIVPTIPRVKVSEIRERDLPLSHKLVHKPIRPLRKRALLPESRDVRSPRIILLDWEFRPMLVEPHSLFIQAFEPLEKLEHPRITEMSGDKTGVTIVLCAHVLLPTPVPEVRLRLSADSMYLSSYIIPYLSSIVNNIMTVISYTNACKITLL